MGRDLIVEIKKRKISRRIKNSDIARGLGVSPGTITQYFNEEQQIRIGFIHFVKLIEIVYDDSVEKRKKLLYEFCSTTKRPENLRLAMEYSHMIGETELLEMIINLDLNQKRPNDEWASVYSILLNRSLGKLRGTELLQASEELLNQRKLKTNEMRILIKVIKMYAYFEMNEHGSMFKLTQELSLEIDTIKNTYIQESYRVRMLEAYALGYLFGNDLESARETAREIINTEYVEQFGLYVANAFHVLAQSYLFESYKEVEKYIQNGLDVLQNISSTRVKMMKKQMNSTYVFSKVHWSESVDEETLENKGELLHLMAKKGKRKEADSILSSLEEENGKLSAFQIYYKGLLYNDDQLLRKSLELFKTQGNKFYSKLPLIQLKKISDEQNQNLELIW